MPRNARAYAPGGAYHLTARGVADQAIFVSAFDCLHFVALLRDVTRRVGWTVAAWCLMHTHYHLVVLADPLARVSDAMHRLNGIYAREFNRRHDRRGHVFGERYSPTAIEGERHFDAACAYVLLNPVTAGLVRRVDDWTWSGDHRLEPRSADLNRHQLGTQP